MKMEVTQKHISVDMVLKTNRHSLSVDLYDTKNRYMQRAARQINFTDNSQ